MGHGNGIKDRGNRTNHACGLESGSLPQCHEIYLNRPTYTVDKYTFHSAQKEVQSIYADLVAEERHLAITIMRLLFLV